MAERDFSCPCIIGYGSSPSRCGPSLSGDDRDREFWLSLASTWTALAIGIDYVGEAGRPHAHERGVEGGVRI